MTAQRGFPAWTVAAAVLLTGCFASTRTASHALESLRAAPLDGDTVVGPTLEDPWQVVRFDPTSSVRFELSEGKWTNWVTAGDLDVSADGLLLGSATKSLSTVRRIVVDTLTDEELAGFAACVPPPADGRVVLSGSTQEVATAVRCVGEAQARLGAPVPGAWTLVFADGETMKGQSGGTVVGLLAAPLQVPTGVRFDDVRRAEVSNFSGSLTLIATGVVLLAIAAGGVSGLGSGFNGGSGDVGGPRVTKQTLFRGGATSPAPTLAGARPLFTESEVRRASARWLVWVDAGSQLDAAKQVALSPFVGVRVANVFEAGIGASLYWEEPLRTTPISDVPLGPQRSAQVPFSMLVFRGLFTFELDPYRRVNMPLGLDVGTGFTGGLQVRVRFGLRVRLGDFWLGVMPANPTYSARLGGLTPPWAFPTTVEVGAEF